MGFSSSSSFTRSAAATAAASTTMSFCNYYYYYFLLVTTSLLLLLLLCPSDAQQTYINNKQLDCYNNLSLTNGYLCNGLEKSCTSYLTFRSQPPYDSATDIGYLLDSPPTEIATINNITDVDKIPTDTLVIVPVNCSCSGGGGGYYQHNSSYVLKYTGETYFKVANDTYQGLTTCQALMSQNPVESRKLIAKLKLTVPLRCACPTRNQTDAGIKFLLSYLVTWGDSISSIAETFLGGGGGSSSSSSNKAEEEEQNINQANEFLSATDLIFPFTPLLVPLKTQPTTITTKRTTSSSPSPPPPTNPNSSSSSGGGGKKKKKWGIIGIAIGLTFLLALSGFLVWFFLGRRSSSRRVRFDKDNSILPQFDGKLGAIHHESNPSSSSVSSLQGGVQYAMDSLILYKFQVLQNATEFFSEDNRIKGSVYRGLINGDTAAIKRMKGDVSNEISILKQINHSNVIRLSGFCVNQGNTYLVYEFAENGSLSDWLHENDNDKNKDKDDDKDKKNGCLGWKQRVQIAYHVADGLNYLHNYANPPYIHKDLKSSNILLDSNFRAKIANFGVARTLEMNNNNNNEGGDGALQLTRHVVGTQGYMPPEYLENGVITPKLDVYSFGVVMLELLSGREAATTTPSDNGKSSPQGGGTLLSASINTVLEGENVRAKLIDYIDPSLGQHEYPLDLVFSMAQLARDCVAPDLNKRPTMLSVFMSMSKILSSSLDWDPSNELEHSRSWKVM